MKDDAFDAIRFRNLGLRGDRAAAHDAVVKQIEAEKASALSRAVEKLQVAWEAAMALRHDATKYEVARERAERARWELRIHRDALGLPWHPDYDRLWPALPKRPEVP